MTRFVAIIVLCLAAACGGTDPRVRLTGEWPPRVGEYETVTREWTRSAVLRGSYQEVMELSATFKSPEWHAAHAERDATNRGLAGDAKTQRLAQAQADAAGPYEIEPLEIVRDKRPSFVVRTEFPALGDFAQPYIIRFPREANILGPEVRQVRLRISGERGGLQVTWDAP